MVKPSKFEAFEDFGAVRRVSVRNMRMDATLNEVCAMHPTALHILNLGDAAPVAYIGSMHVMLHALAWLLYAAICCSDRKSISRCPRN